MNTTSNKKFYSQTQNVDIETGELLSKNRLQTEDWIKKGNETEFKDCGAYILKLNTTKYEKSRQLKIKF